MGFTLQILEELGGREEEGVDVFCFVFQSFLNFSFIFMGELGKKYICLVGVTDRLLFLKGLKGILIAFTSVKIHETKIHQV